MFCLILLLLVQKLKAERRANEQQRLLEEAAEIAKLKETITSLLDHIPGMTFTKDAKTGVYLACNQAFAAYAHKESPAGVVGLTDAEIFDPETAAHFVEDDRMALSMEEPYIFFEDVPDAAGNQRQFQTTKRKFVDTMGRLCVLGICQDVTDMVRIQREHARMVLEEVGIRVDVSMSGEEALRMLELQHLKQEPYNLVLLDWKMPVMDGVETAKEIRARYSSETTIVILTAYNWDEILDEAVKAGVDSFLSKPLFASNVISEFGYIARRSQSHLFEEKKRAELAGRRILLAEDIEINAEIMLDILDMEEMEADHAENGRIVVEMFEKSAVDTYDAILMDIRMPEMDGLEAAEAIRTLDRPDAKRIPIIVLTANAFDEDVQRSLQAGMNAHLSKPVEPDHLYQTLGELIYQAEQSKG